jgi:hypothetical protein
MTFIAAPGASGSPFGQTMQTAMAGTGSPRNAKNGTEAANDLLNPNNPYFYDPSLYQRDPGYNPETAKAQAFAATLSGYAQKGDYTDIAQFLTTLGPAQDAKLAAGAINQLLPPSFAPDLDVIRNAFIWWSVHVPPPHGPA